MQSDVSVILYWIDFIYVMKIFGISIDLVPPSIDAIEGDQGDGNYSHFLNDEGFKLVIKNVSHHEGISKRSAINNCPSNCESIGEWISMDTNDGTGDHENF